MKKKFLLLLAILAVIIACSVLFVIVVKAPAFDGNSIKNTDEYVLDVKRMNGTDQHTLSLHAGDVLQVHFEVKAGNMKLSIAAPHEEIIYAGNGEAQRDFTVNITKDGDYAITVIGTQATADLRICVLR